MPEAARPPTWREWKARTGRRWWRYLLVVEWALEWFVYRLRSLALFDLLELAGKLTVLVAVVFWFLEADQRARQAEEAIKERHYRAWELINAAAGKAGDGGRRDALQDLNNDGVNLAAAPLEKAYLVRVDLKGAHLEGANLQGADLWDTNFGNADLYGADLEGVPLWNANFQDAFLTDANLRGTVIRGDTNFQGVDLMKANLQGANVRDANLKGARNLTQEQLDGARGDDRTVLPEGLTRPAHWSKAEGSEGPPAPQPDTAGRAPAAAGAPGSDQ